MRVSKSELTYVLKQAFEGCGYDFGACENMAAQIVWAEMHDLGGLKILDGLISAGIKAPNHSWDIHTIDGAEIRFSAQDLSVLYVCDLGVSLATAKCKEANLTKLVFEQARDAVLLCSTLLDISANGRSGLVYQLDGENKDIGHWARSSAGKTALTMGNGWLEGTSIDQGSKNIALVVGNDDVEIDGYIKTTNIKLGKTMGSHLFSECYQNSLEAGIEVSDKIWRCLNKIGAKVLVEATEASRKGAGE